MFSTPETSVHVLDKNREILMYAQVHRVRVVTRSNECLSVCYSILSVIK